MQTEEAQLCCQGPLLPHSAAVSPCLQIPPRPPFAEGDWGGFPRRRGFLYPGMGQAEEFPPHRLHLELSLLQTAIIVNDVVRERQFLPKRHLRLDGLTSLVQRKPIPLHESGELNLLFHKDHHYPVEALDRPHLHQER